MRERVRPHLQQRAQDRATRSSRLEELRPPRMHFSGWHGQAQWRVLGSWCPPCRWLPLLESEAHPCSHAGMTVGDTQGPFLLLETRQRPPGGTHFGDTRPWRSGLGTCSSRLPSSGSNLPMCSGLVSALKTHEGLLPGRILGCSRRALSCSAHLPPCAAHRWGSAAHGHPWLPL